MFSINFALEFIYCKNIGKGWEPDQCDLIHCLYVYLHSPLGIRVIREVPSHGLELAAAALVRGVVTVTLPGLQFSS